MNNLIFPKMVFSYIKKKFKKKRFLPQMIFNFISKYMFYM